MSAFRTSATGLLRLATDGVLADRVAEHLWAMRHGVNPAERRSWKGSLPVLAQDLLDAGLGDVEVLVEYQLPLTSRRIDAVLAGVDPRTGDDSYLVVELKGWSYATAYEDSDTLVAVEHARGPRLHPGVQVADYCEYLTDFLGALGHLKTTLRGAAYLHNAVDRDVTDLLDRPATEQSRLFTGQRRGQWLDYLRSRFAPKSGAGAADRFLTSPVRPSKHLLRYAQQELRERSHFTLLDEQHVAYEMVMHAIERARTANRRRAVIVAGGPGSGKSVIALSVMGELARRNRPVLHATGSRSFTQTMRRYAGRGSTRMRDMFKYFNSFMDADPQDIEVLLCDEAHRIRETSVNRYTTKARRDRARPQLEELIAAARVPVFLLDEHQVVKPGELGNVEIISAYAESLGLDVELVPLHDQFRCGGSEAYEQWVLDLLGLDGGEPVVWAGDGRFDLRLAESPEQLEAFLRSRQRSGVDGRAGQTARMSAGYCWPWSKPRPDGTLVPDVVVGDWARPWNVNSDRSVGDAPGSAFWATDPNGFGQVGCVYTAQGFEYDWSGVIIGPDLVARDGRLVTRRAESKDPAFRSRKAVSDDEADRLIRNTYKVLLTRGMRGTAIVSTDPETRDFLARLVRPERPVETRYEEPNDG
ncbi:DNA/RNA helicase domain-containing protein [Plantactinospora sp. GCM10030261]|uniref:DNA/RNA helicase domain-containing protein n=1 Tax=Plantactinospora sp. GCM10030261 TaxID=3273420 RepID=UPI003612E5D6